MRRMSMPEIVLLIAWVDMVGGVDLPGGDWSSKASSPWSPSLDCLGGSASPSLGQASPLISFQTTRSIPPSPFLLPQQPIIPFLMFVLLDVVPPHWLSEGGSRGMPEVPVI